MFMRELGEKTLVFRYGHPAARLFHTFCCPPLRILALSEQGEIIYDRVVGPNRFVRLPPTSIIIEIDPQRKELPSDLGIQMAQAETEAET